MSIERYDPIRVLGEGSFGKVYLMRDKVKRNFVCVKIIKIKNIPKKEREATKVEVDLLRRLHHPNIVRYIDSFLSKNNESLCICMEYCDGGDLASQIKGARRNLFSESKILHWFVQLALGLHYMHTNRVLHRDLKTQNVFMLGNGRLVLGDLGISKVLDGTMDFAQTCIGTPYYMSPEIFKNKPYSYKSDVWALGCVLYEMTTLNHAFDANSLNGLATKIVKGKYPPINAKYSKFLRDLIGEMLQINPAQRPDLDQILKKPFIKKHIVNFFSDIASRPSANIGEGTMIFKNAANGVAGNDSNMISLRQQLHALNMTDALSDALKPKSNPQDDDEAIRQAKEQASALKREQDHKRMVEAALEKLRLERENRKNVDAFGRPVGYAAPGRQAGGKQRVEDLQRQQQQAAQQQQQQPAAQRAPSQAQISNAALEAARKEAAAGNRGVGGAVKREDKESAPAANDRAGAVRRRSFGEDQNKIGERDRRAAEEQRQRRVLEDQERDIARKRDEVRAEARAREEARLREDSRQKEEAAAAAAAAAQKEKLMQVRAAAEAQAKAKREAQKDKDRQAKEDEIAQLKRDKLELDRRALEKDARRQEERRRLEGPARGGGGREAQLEAMQDKLSQMNEQIQQIPKFDRNNRAAAAAEDKEEVSARERVQQRRQEKAARDEADRLEALREAEAENRRIRHLAQAQHRSQFHSEDNRNPANIGRAAYPVVAADEEKYEFDRNRNKGRMDEAEMGDRLNEANRGRSKYDNNDAVPNTGRSAQVPNTGRSSIGSHARNATDEEHGSDTASEGEESLWEQGSHNMEEEEEDLHRREEELKAELNFATLRVNELKRTLQETKSYLGPRLPTRGSNLPNQARIPSADDDDFEGDEEDLFGEDDEEFEEYVDTTPVSSKHNSYDGRNKAAPADRIDETVRRVRDSHSNYSALQDPPSPSGRLGDRIDRLRQRCTEALGKFAFNEAYTFLKQHEEESQGYDNGRDLNEDDYEQKKITKMRSILGDGKAHYLSLIEQLIFMEETHMG